MVKQRCARKLLGKYLKRKEGTHVISLQPSPSHSSLLFSPTHSLTFRLVSRENQDHVAVIVFSLSCSQKGGAQIS